MLTKAPYDGRFAGFRRKGPGPLNIAAQVRNFWAKRAPGQVAIAGLGGGRDQIAYAQHRLTGHRPMAVTGKVIRKNLKARGAAERPS